MIVARLSFAVGLVLAGCGTALAPDAGAIDAGMDAPIDAPPADAGLDAPAPQDAGEIDAPADAAEDASTLDGSSIDAAPIDGATIDAPATDAGPIDAGPNDAGPIDAGIVRTSDPPTHPAATPIAPFTECTVTTATDAISGAGHRAPCEAIPYPYHPPSAGAHYSQWADFGTYDAPVPWGFLVHALEHGAVVLAYHCESDADCATVRAEYASIVADRGLDPTCRVEDTPSRFVVMPDPTLPVPIAAVAWRHVYLATCLDPTSLRAFVAAHYATAPEDVCAPGVDLSATGWCP